MKKFNKNIFSVISLDKEIGGISKMIELSSLIMSEKVKKVFILLQYNTATYLHIKKQFINNKKINVIGISKIEKILLSNRIISKNIKNVLNASDYIFIHNALLAKSLKFFKKKKANNTFFSH